MAIYKVQAPDGSIVKIEGPDGASESEVIAQAKRLFAAQQPAKLSQQERFEAERDRLLKEQAEETGGLEAFAVGAGRGLANVGRGVGRLFGADVGPDESENRALAALKEARPYSTGAGEIAGESVPFLLAAPAGGLSTAGRIAAGAGIGATQGGITSAGRGESADEIIQNTVLGGALGGAAEVALPVLGRGVRAAYRKLTGAPQKDVASGVVRELAEESGLTADDLASGVLDRVTAAGDVDPRQAARLAAFQSLDPNLAPTRAELTRDATTFQAQQELAKKTGKVRTALENADAIITSRFNQQIDRTLGDAQSKAASVADVVLNKATKLDEEISTLYKEARAAAGKQKIVKPVALGSQIRSIAADDTRTGGAISSIVGELKKRGIMDKDMNVIGRVSVDTMEEVRKHINSLHDPANKFANARLKDLKNALDDDVMKQSGGDLYARARGAKAAFERELDTAKVSKFDKREQHIVEDLLENRIDPDRLIEDVIYARKWRPSDVSKLRSYVEAAEGGKEAINDLRASVLETIKQKSMIGPEDGSGFRKMSFDRFKAEIDKIGPAKLGAILDDEERKFLRQLGAVLKLKTPVAGTALGQGPSAQAINSLRRSFANIPWAGQIIDSVSVGAQNRVMARALPELIKRTPGSKELAANRAAAAGAVAYTGRDKKEERQ